MKTFKYLAMLLSGFFVFAACQKEFSMESGLTGDPATGSLQSDSGNCRPITPYGSYVRDTALTDSNYVVVQVNIATPGLYKIYTDTANGFSFYDSGYIAATGLQYFKLKSSGTPILGQPTDFIVAFDSTFCRFTIAVSDTAIPPPIITPVTSGDYFPTGDSSNWTYEEAITGDTNHITVLTIDTAFGPNSYRRFAYSNSLAGPDTAYYRKGGGIYYQYSNLDEFSLYDTVNSKVDYIFLKDNEPVNSTWESPEVGAVFNSVSGKAKIKFTIIGKDIQTTIGNTTIDSVIQVKREYMFAPDVTGTYQTLGSVDFYYAKNIGLIKAETTAPVPVSINIRRWDIYF